MINITLKSESNLRLLIGQSGHNISGFAKEVGISHSYLSQILNGKRNPSPKVAANIAKNLSSNLEDIFLLSVVAKDNLKLETFN
ncbi:MAG: helix-turn-helix transcriptional regulator [Neobacillus sp.]